MASYEKRPSGKIRARIRLKGVRDSQEFERITDARAWAAKRETEIREGRAFGNARKTLAQAIAKYLSEEAPRLAPKAQRGRREHLAWWTARLGPELLVSIDRPAVQSALRLLRERGPKGRPVCFATANRYKAALGAVLTCAVEDWHWLPFHPLRGGGRRKRPKGEREVERERELSPEERTALWAACKASRDHRLYALIVCAYYSGAREESELMSIERSRLQLRPVVYDPETGTRKPGVPRAEVLDSKAGDSRVLYFPGEAADVLREREKMPRLSRYVFAGPKDAPDQPPAFPTSAWRTARKVAGVEDFRFHDLRHCWACNLLDAGATLAQLMVLGGWRSAAMVRRYAKRAQREGSAPVELMDRLSRT